MNNIAILPYICLHALQIQNIKRDVVKKVSIENLNKVNSNAYKKLENNEYNSETIINSNQTTNIPDTILENDNNRIEINN